MQRLAQMNNQGRTEGAPEAVWPRLAARESTVGRRPDVARPATFCLRLAAQERDLLDTLLGKLLVFIVLAIMALVILKFLIKVSLLIASVIAVLLVVGLFARQKMH